MKLYDYIYAERGRLRAVAKKAKTSPGNLSRIAQGIQRPRDDMAKRIVKATNGAVSFEEIMGLEYAA